MPSFTLTTHDHIQIRFVCYHTEAPVTTAAFLAQLPFTRIFYHARVSGQEIWIDDMPPLDIIQENASVFTEPGEVVLGPSKPSRTRTANCFGVYYGEGRGLDACNIFAKVVEADMPKLMALGQRIWVHGAESVTVAALE